MIRAFRSCVKEHRLPLLLTHLIVTAAVLVSLVQTGHAAKKRPLMRYPDIHGNSIAFVYGEDIWMAPSTGGVATRLTLHDGAERYPKFSPDGKMIAFTAEYDGNADVYVMNVHGGGITRVTYHPYGDEVIGWHPVKNKILFQSFRNSFNRFTRLFLINPDGTGLEELIMHEAARGSYSPDGTKIAYNRVAREHRTWKRYKGGLAQDIYLFDFEKQEDSKLTTFGGTDRLPMWIGETIYFSSDRDGMLNLYTLDPNSGDIKQVTRHKDFDVRRPSMGEDKIIYELGGSLWVFDTATGKSSEVPVEIHADAPELRAYIKTVDEYVTGVDISPSGKRALVTARGEVFTVPKENGPTRNLTNDCGSRDKDAAWSPDGKHIAYLSDKEGEYEIYIVDPMGSEEAVRLSTHKDGYRHTLRWSPDSKKIAFTDHTLTCHILDVVSKKITKVDRAEFENIDVGLDVKPIYDFTWSPDSRYIAYSKMNEDLVFQVYIYSLDSGKAHCVSNGVYNDFEPVFTEDGKHLLFVSNRRFRPVLCDFEWEMVYKDVAGIYALTLAKDGEPILPYESDEEEIKKDDDGDKKKDDDKKDDKKKEDKIEVTIDFDGIADRIEHLPLSAGNYRDLQVNDGNIFYLNKDEGDFNRFEYRAIGPMDLYRFSFEDREEESVISGITGYKVSADGKSIVYRKRSSIGIIKASAKDAKAKDLDLSELKMHLDPLTEWTQIFNEVWRMERDFYYEPNMHGVNWDKMKKRYGQLMPFVSCREDVRYVIGELIGELNTSHTYVFGGDYKREAEYVNVGMLGVDWMVDEKSNRYQFKKVLRTPCWTREILPPLARPGIDIADGDYLIQVNGRDVTADRSIYSYFQDLSGKQVTLLVNDKPESKGAKEYTVEPTGGEFTLRYLDWVEHNRQVVDKASNGEIGYLHLPDTYLGSAREFPKYFYSSLRKKGIVVDGRFNGGGLDPDIFLRRLDKEILGYWTRRYSHDQTNPAMATTAHLALLTNRQAGSGGDMLPMEFQLKKMGPVIGTRTWGGLVGVSMWLSLIDGGGFSAPDYRIYGADGKWVVENEGVTPDIIVDLDPVEMSKGHDAQLLKAVEYLQDKVKNDPRSWPKHDAFKVDKQ